MVQIRVKMAQQAAAAAAQQIMVRERVMLEALRQRQRKGLQAAGRLAPQCLSEAVVVLGMVLAV